MNEKKRMNVKENYCMKKELKQKYNIENWKKIN